MANPLTELLLTLVNRTQFNSETDRDHAMDLLREIDGDAVPPAPGPMNEPAATPTVDPGPVAEPVPAQEQVPPPTSPEVAGATPEATNAFTEPQPQ
jgi:hypothetical protein